MAWLALLLVALLLPSSPSPAQTVDPPEVIGTLAGPGSGQTPDLAFYGTDLGWTFEHRGKLLALFGDTWPFASFLCDPPPVNDDTQATLPLEPPAGLPPIAFASAGGALQNLRVLAGGESLSMGFGKTPVTGFSDGTDAFGVFLRGDYVRCARRGARGRLTCRGTPHLECADDVGECQPVALGLPMLCDLTTRSGCLAGSTCEPIAEGGVCIDPTSPQSDGTSASHRYMAADRLQIAVQDGAVPTDYHSAIVLPSNKFTNVNARTVSRFSGKVRGNDYRVGHATLLLWGRPGFVAEGGREAQLFLLAHRLPFKRDRAGRLRFKPRYFAGLGKRGEPRWSRRESQAKALAMDGLPGGDPHEEQPIAAQTSIGWVGEPVNRWMMLYSGNLANYLLQDPANARPGASPGSVRVRFAEHPWGPWSPAVPHLAPGDPSVPGDQYAPGGLLFHFACQDQGGLLCARSDPRRPPDAFLPGCPGVGATFDIGNFYAPNIIDAYTRADGAGAADVYWNVSTWNPYAVAFLRTKVRPAE